MFGKVIKIVGDTIYVQNLAGKAETGVLGYHVVFNDANRQIVGEIENIDAEAVEILLIGEIINNAFIPGAIKKPNAEAGCRIITKRELEYILGSQDYTKKNNVLIGDSLTYPGFKITADVNQLFANHFAVLGNTGSGKSCSVTRIIQNIFYYNDEVMPTKSHFVIFDVYGEYNHAFLGLNKLPNMGYKCYTTDTTGRVDGDIVKIPAYFLGVDELALLLNVDDPTIIPVIENTLRLVYIFNSQDEKTVKYKDYIIASRVMDILSSGKTANQLRDQIIAMLTKYNTKNINLDSTIKSPGYNRTFKQCLLIDNQGKMNAIDLVIDFLKDFTSFDLNSLDIVPNFVYTLDDLASALEFSLINEGVLNSNTQFDKLNKLKVRLNSIINSDYKKFFEFKDVISKNEYIKRFFSKNDGTPVQLVNMNLNYIDERMAKTLTKIYAKLFYNYVTSIKPRASFPIHMIIEEAHRYIKSDNDIEIIGYNIFDRITKEGRKYGIILGLITQRPSELSTTSISQCSNFIVLKLYYPDDLELIKKITANISENMINKVKTLRPGMALCFGNAFKVPLVASLGLPDPMPESTSVNLVDTWF